MTTRDRVLLAIVALRERSGFSPLQKELAAEVELCRGNITRALRRLQEEGLIGRKRSHIEVTAIGLARIDRLRQAPESNRGSV